MGRTTATYCALALLGAGVVHAQTASVRGTVQDAITGAIVPAATLEPAGLGRAIVADDSGRFVIPSLPEEGVRVLVRHVGYAPLDLLLMPRTEPVTVRLTRAATSLDTLQVNARGSDALPVSATLPEFEARRARATGRFIATAELRKEEDRVLVDVLRSRIPGLLFESASDGVHAYNPGQQAPGALRGRAPQKCYVQVVVDGNAIYQISMDGKDNRPPDLSEYQTRGLDGVEYYASPSRTPAELRTTGSLCGTLVFWTRRR